jgi:hypothetical protein
MQGSRSLSHAVCDFSTRYFSSNARPPTSKRGSGAEFDTRVKLNENFDMLTHSSHLGFELKSEIRTQNAFERHQTRLVYGDKQIRPDSTLKKVSWF